MGRGQELFFTLHGAGAGHDLHFFTANQMTAHIDAGVGRVGFAADQLVPLLDRHDALNDLGKVAGQAFEGLMRQFVADGADDGAGHSAHDVGFVTEPFYLLQDSRFVF